MAPSCDSIMRVLSRNQSLRKRENFSDGEASVIALQLRMSVANKTTHSLVI